MVLFKHAGSRSPMAKALRAAAVAICWFLPAAAAAQNPVVLENQQPGTTAWQISNVGTDAVGQIKG